MRVLDLFSGIGGFSLGLERAGMKTVAFSEIDPYCTRVLAKHWPEVPNLGDITAAEFEPGSADVICGGFPCQDISNAGQRAGITGERSGLYRELVRAIRMVRPRHAIMENVSALLGRGMGTVLGDLAEIGADAEWHCIPASAVGAPHQRDRVWIVADTGSEQHEGHRPPLSGSIAAELSRTTADADSEAVRQQSECEFWSRGAAVTGADGKDGPLADANQPRLEGRDEHRVDPGQWTSRAGMQSLAGHWRAEPDVGRVAHGVPSRVDRLRALGNSVVPQIPEMIGRALMEARAA